MTWFTEDSLIPLITGCFLAIAFLVLAVMHYNRTMLLIALGIGVITAAIVATEVYIVTDKEAVEGVVRTLAGAVEQNDVAAVMGHVSPKRQDVISRIGQEMPNYRIQSCRLIDFVDFKCNESANPKTATIVFVVIARGEDRSTAMQGLVHQRVTLHFEQQPDQSWKMIDYAHEYARAGGRL